MLPVKETTVAKVSKKKGVNMVGMTYIKSYLLNKYKQYNLGNAQIDLFSEITDTFGKDKAATTMLRVFNDHEWLESIVDFKVSGIKSGDPNIPDQVIRSFTATIPIFLQSDVSKLWSIVPQVDKIKSLQLINMVVPVGSVYIAGDDELVWTVSLTEFINEDNATLTSYVDPQLDNLTILIVNGYPIAHEKISDTVSLIQTSNK